MTQAVHERAVSALDVLRLPSTSRADAQARAKSIQEFLAFKLGSEEYGIDIQRVREIRSYEQPTRIASAPPHVKGVINLRGVIVPVVDLRLKFSLADTAYDATTVVIVVDTGKRVVGIVVDSVSDVMRFAPEQLLQAPHVDTPLCTDHLIGIGSVDARLLLLIDVVSLLTGVDMGLSA